MFDLDITDETAAVVGMSRSMALNVLSPAAKSGEQTASLPDAVRSALFETGLTTPVGEQFGGGGVPSCATMFAAVEALSYGDPGLTMAAVWSGAVALIVEALGSDAQKQAVLPRFATDAKAHGAVALYEGHGRAPSESVTTISRSSNGTTWTIAGTKLAVAGALTADPLLVVGTDPSNGALRVAMISPDYPGVVVASPQRHIALDAAQLSTVSFDCEVPTDALLGGSDVDQAAVHLAISELRLMVAAAGLGVAQRAVDYAAKYATERVAFGKPISAFQGVSFLLADASIRIAAAKVEVIDVSCRIDARSASNIEAHTTEAVNYCGVVATQATRDSIQVLGGHGFITDHPVELWYRSAAALASLDFDPLCSTFEPSL